MRRYGLIGLIVLICAIGSTTAFGHTYSWTGGDGNNNMYGHEHRDEFYGKGGCDDLQGNAAGDYLVGGASGCDAVRGGPGDYDVSVVWDDATGGDYATGGGGLGDVCYVGQKDTIGEGCDAISIG